MSSSTSSSSSSSQPATTSKSSSSVRGAFSFLGPKKNQELSAPNQGGRGKEGTGGNVSSGKKVEFVASAPSQTQSQTPSQSQVGILWQQI